MTDLSQLADRIERLDGPSEATLHMAKILGLAWKRSPVWKRAKDQADGR